MEDRGKPCFHCVIAPLDGSGCEDLRLSAVTERQTSDDNKADGSEHRFLPDMMPVFSKAFQFSIMEKGDPFEPPLY